MKMATQFLLLHTFVNIITVEDNFNTFYNGGMCTKHNAVVANCMTECGNFLVCLLETRCPQLRYNAVNFLAQTKQCCIVKDWHGTKRYKIAPVAELTVGMTEVQKYVILYLFM